MKKLYFFLLLIPAFGLSQNKTYFNGYIVMAKTPNDTLFGEEITITANSFLNVKLLQGKKKVKYEKADLIDFGYISKNGEKRISKYAEMAFLKPAFKGLYLYGLNQDTIHCYIEKDDVQSVFKKITCYDRSYQKMDGYKEWHLHEVKSFMIIDDRGNEVWYDAMRMELENYEMAGLDEVITIQSYISSYAIRLNDGKIRLNQTKARVRGNFVGVYILEKNYKTSIVFIENGLLNINTKENIGELMSDVPFLLKHLHTKGYEAIYYHVQEFFRTLKKIDLERLLHQR